MRPSSAALLLSLLPACSMATLQQVTDSIDDLDESTSSSTGDDASGSTWSGPVSTVTSATAGSSSSGDAGDTDGATSGIDETTSGDADAPPAISKHELSPNPIQIAGAIEAKIWIDGDADGVRMNLEDGTEVELLLDPDTKSFFSGEILAYSGLLQNSDEYVATFTPWRDDDGDIVEGEALEVPYAIQLHDSGEEDLWDLDKSSGSGHVTAIGVLPGGDTIELLTLAKGNTSACYLRRRDPQGNTGPDDVVAVLSDRCRGTSLEVGHDGATYILIEAETNIGWMWWAAKMAHFGAPLKSLAYGEVDEVARDLAVSPSGTVAVCGSTPTPEPGDLEDAAVWIVRPDFSTYSKTFDYKPGIQGHTMDERANGCSFIDDGRVIFVGEVFGKHYQNLKVNRRFDVVYDVETDHGDLRVASADGLATQSFATDVAVDYDADRVYIVGHICGNNVCDQVEAQMWMLDGEGDLASTTSLGLYSNKALTPSKIRVSPAGYIVVASGGLAGTEGAFSVRAYAPFKAEPLWSYLRLDADLVHLPNALAIGPYGQVYAGGFGANGFPLFVIIYG